MTHADVTLTDIRQSLADVYTEEGIRIWLTSPNRNLDGRSPLALICDGDGRAVLEEVDRLAGGAYA